MKATLKKVVHFEVTLDNRPAGMFRQISTWEGLAKLENDKGEVLLVVAPDGLRAVIDDVFGIGSEVPVVSASPSLHHCPASTAGEKA